MRNIAISLQDIVLKSQKSIEQLVEEAFGFSYDSEGNRRAAKSHNTLYRELNPEDPGAKLGFLDGVLLMQATGNYTPLSLAANKLGLRLVPDGAAPDHDSVQEECLDDYAALTLFTQSVRGGDHPGVVRQAADKAIREIEETLTAYIMNQGGNNK